jgi:multidrug efflux pump subunit AcrA (membrane-fusion protein)
MRLLKVLGGVLLLVVVAGILFVVVVARERWFGRGDAQAPDANGRAHDESNAAVTSVLRLSPQARQNLRLVSKPVALQEYWRKIQTPGMVVDRPGVTDRGVTAPVEGVVTQIHALAGETVRSGEMLFTLRLYSEHLHKTQSDLFKAAREIQLIRQERTRLSGPAESGVIAGNRIIELDREIRRQEGLVQAYRQELRARGLQDVQISEAEAGQFVATINIVVPPAEVVPNASAVQPVALTEGDGSMELVYEVQELKVDLGQQVQAGQLLSVLSNHRSLYIEGHAFKQEAPLVERATQNGWSIDVEFADDDAQDWPPLDQTLEIRHLSNTIDAGSRTFDFYIPLTNQSRTYEKDGRTFIVWRLRPGQRVRLHVPVERYEEVIVLPAAAVVREGPEAYVFRQNGDLFNRMPVHVLHEDRLKVIIANDGSVPLGSYLAQSSAASLNRVLKAQSASGVRADVHVHADGTVHAAH